MRYESAKTEKGNVCVSYDSQEAADLQAVAMDENGNTNCYNCTDCRYCTGCHGCHGCRYCTGCHGCHGCHGCRGCHGWSGEPAKALLSINGLRWPVSTDGKSIQIGCQHHSVDGWRAFDDWVIARMGPDALAFWKAHKDMVLDLAEVRAAVQEVTEEES